jgi:beta-glucanase (GH16 family)
LGNDEKILFRLGCSVEWDENVIRWYIDNILFHSVGEEDLGSNIYPFNQDFYFISHQTSTVVSDT